MTSIIIRRPMTANMRNSRGAGPRTLAGKARSRGNALKHGLTAKSLLLPHESAEEYDEFRSGVLAEFAPHGILESRFAESIANLLWRIQRIPEFEAALFNWSEHFEAVQENANASFDSYFLNPSGEHQPKKSAGGGKSAENLAAEARRQALAYGRALDGMLTEGILDKLSRYEASLQRQLKQAMQTLFELQVQRAELYPELSEIEAVAEDVKVVTEDEKIVAEDVTAVVEVKTPSPVRSTSQEPAAGVASQEEGSASPPATAAARPTQTSRTNALQPFLANRGAHSRPARLAEPAGGYLGPDGERQKS